MVEAKLHAIGLRFAAEATTRFRRWPISELLAADLTFQWDAVGLLVRPTYGVDTGELKTLKSYVGTSRAIGILPFFLLGWHVRQWNVVGWWRDLGSRAWIVRAVAVAVFAG